VAVVGCGAISQNFHIPVLAGHESVRLAALVDCDVERARALARLYDVAAVHADASSLTPELVDAAVVATPPWHHAPCCNDLAGRGIHVLVEKPMAVTQGEAGAMADTARDAGVTLAAGYFRRLFPSVRLLRAALDREALGCPVGFDAEEGGEYGWNLATLGNLRKDQGGGGVLIDIGSHVIDLLLYLFPGTAEMLEYRDNSLGGVETDCEARLRLERDGRAVEGRVGLSRTRRLRNTLRVACERGTLELRVGEFSKVKVIPQGVHLEDPVSSRPREFALQAGWADQPETVGYEVYRAAIDDWLGAIRTGSPPQLSGGSALRTVGLIEDCYRQAGRLEEPWFWEGLPRPAAASNGSAPAPRTARRTRRVLVTGATGFIGCRAAEVLHLGGDWKVRTLVHKPSSAARLARLPVEMVQGDLRSPEDLARAVDGCDAVVHCAIGTAYGRRREVFAVTVDGTRALAQAALAAGVRRFVHLSTTAVHGTDITGVVDETTPARPPKGSDYAASKLSAERVVERAVRRGLPAVTLRLANVYGPYGATLITRPIRHLARGSLALIGGDEKPSNTVYVDNVAGAIVRALEAEEGGVVGEVFAIAAEDEMTWADFYGCFARELGLDPPHVTDSRARPESDGRGPARRAGAWGRGTAELIRAPELRALARKVLETDPYGAIPRWALGRFPGIERAARRALRLDAAVVYRRPGPVGGGEAMTMDPAAARVSIEKARRVLGYEPAVPRQRAMELTLDWVRWWLRSNP
jgi:nucleoside-diphosphate-sugar epimerase/predicted dehydrogenase